jgi:hypothetical protein
VVGLVDVVRRMTASHPDETETALLTVIGIVLLLALV